MFVAYGRRVGVWGSVSRDGLVLSKRFTGTRCRREQVAMARAMAMAMGSGQWRIVGEDYVDIPTHAYLVPTLHYPPTQLTSERRRPSILTRAPVPFGSCIVRGLWNVGQGFRQQPSPLGVICFVLCGGTILCRGKSRFGHNALLCIRHYHLQRPTLHSAKTRFANLLPNVERLASRPCLPRRWLFIRGYSTRVEQDAPIDLVKSSCWAIYVHI
jgi:hypothetical protein